MWTLVLGCSGIGEIENVIFQVEVWSHVLRWQLVDILSATMFAQGCTSRLPGCMCNDTTVRHWFFSFSPCFGILEAVFAAIGWLLDICNNGLALRGSIWMQHLCKKESFWCWVAWKNLQQTETGIFGLVPSFGILWRWRCVIFSCDGAFWHISCWLWQQNFWWDKQQWTQKFANHFRPKHLTWTANWRSNMNHQMNLAHLSNLSKLCCIIDLWCHLHSQCADANIVPNRCKLLTHFHQTIVMKGRQ